jgi:phosphatidylglycerophosphatase A
MTKKISPRQLRNPWNFLALGFGSGLAPVAPGTFGTLVGIPIYFLLQQLSAFHYLLIVVILFNLGIAICCKASEKLGVDDHPAIVWDEIVGYLVTMWMAPAGWLWVVAGFVLFRLFDILKPWPIGWIDRNVSCGLGIMLDDLVAGLFGMAVLQGMIVLLA